MEFREEMNSNNQKIMRRVIDSLFTAVTVGLSELARQLVRVLF